MSIKKSITLIKLGGSLLTDKNKPFSIRRDIVTKTINQIIESQKLVIIIHGGGSFGHPIAKDYKLQEGRNRIIKEQELGLVETHAAMEELNQFIVDAFLVEKKPVLSFQPSAMFFKKRGKTTLKGIEQIEMSLELGIIPILYGDIVYNTNQFFSILSGVEIITQLCKSLRKFKVNKVIFGMEKDGIYIQEEDSEENILAEDILDTEIPHLKLAHFSDKIDVTGGIHGKLKAITKITELGIPVQIVNGLKEGYILKALHNEPVRSTNIRISPKKQKAEIEKRKAEHLQIPLNYNVQHKQNFFDEIDLIHHALPEYDYEKVDLETQLCHYRISAPIVISAITGGTDLARNINKILAQVAQRERIVMSVGSQRIGLEDDSTRYSFQIVREVAPDIPIMGNIGIGQISSSTFSMDDFQKCIEMIDADIMAIHFNALQEILQKHGDRSFKQFEENFKEIRETITLPIFAKEIGNGFDLETIKKLDGLGFDGFDVGGRGGTSFAALEGLRTKEPSKHFTRNLGRTFREWGIPTPASVCYCRHLTKKPIIATGGLRNGIDIAKSLLLGANFGGFANKFLRSAWKDIKIESIENSLKEIQTLKRELKSTMWLLNIQNLSEFKNQENRYIIKKKLEPWIQKIKQN